MHCKDLVHSRCLLDEWLWVSRWMVYGLYSISPFIKPKYLIWSLRVLLAGVFYVWEREEARHPRHLAPQSAKVTATASWITISHTHLASAGIITQGQKAWQSPVTVLSGVLCGERHGDLTDESIKIMPKAFSESDYGDGFKEHVYCSRSAALGIILGTYQMCLMSLCSCNKLRGKSHTSGWKAIDCLRGGGGDRGGTGDGNLLALTGPPALAGGEWELHHLGEGGHALWCDLGSQLLLQSIIVSLSGTGVPTVLFPEEIARVSMCYGKSTDLPRSYLLIHSFGRVTCCLCWEAGRASASISTSQAAPEFPFRHPSIQSPGHRRSSPACLPSW